MIKANPAEHAFVTKAYKMVGELLASGKFKPNPVRKLPQGLAGIERGFKDAEEGKVLKRIQYGAILMCRFERRTSYIRFRRRRKQ